MRVYFKIYANKFASFAFPFFFKFDKNTWIT